MPPPSTPGVAFDVTHLPDHPAVFDLVYIPPGTELVRWARGRGLPATGGAGMLVRQAEAAFQRWTGIEGGGPIMAAAIEELLLASGKASGLTGEEG